MLIKILKKIKQWLDEKFGEKNSEPPNMYPFF